MDGYTVEEAASVLGVPRERVWELLARGILSGSTDLSGGMRVRLKSDASPAPATPPVERPIDAVAGPAAELSPFRELLTEFRSLTERYGQALLALGEARGEVAGLRSRVDMLEARVDLRLPSGSAPTTSSWSTAWPIPTERVVEPPASRSAAPPRTSEEAPAPEHEESGAPPAQDEEGTPHRRRGRAGRRATESFADALARAQDPSIPELPGAAETAAALAAMRQDERVEATRVAEPEAADRDADALPRELPSAEQVPVADEAEPSAPMEATTVTVEAGATAYAEPAAGAKPPESEPSPRIEAEAGADADREAIAEVQVPAAAEEDSAAAAEVEPAEAEPAAEPVAASEAERDERTESHAESDLGWDPEVYSATIEEPGWISADDVPVESADGMPTSPEPLADAASRQAPETTIAPAEAPGDQTRGEARDAVVAPVSSDRHVPLAIEPSGSRSLDEGLAALEALANPQPPTPDPEEDTRETAGAGAGRMEPGGRAAGIPRSQVWTRPSPPLANRSSASRAYRRLRRIFPT